jgi:peptide/nickel transport system substrate-binding protein
MHMEKHTEEVQKPTQVDERGMLFTPVSRRGFVKGTAGVAAIAGLGSLVGCGGSDAGTSSSDKKKVLRFGQANAKQGLDMQKSTNSGSSSVADNVVEAPLHWTEDNELVPCLLTEIPTPEADGVTYKCTLKDGIKFHDGSTLTSTDVKYSFERMFKPATAAKSTYMYDMIVGAKDMLAGTATELTGLTIEDDTHFTFTLEYPMATFAKNLGISYADIFPHEACEAAGDSWGSGTDLIGTGPYKLVSNDDSTLVEFERFEDYHGNAEGYATNLDKLEIHYIDDLNTKMLNFKNGDIDYCDLDSSLLQQYQQDSDVKDLITQYMPLGTQFINLNLNDDALKDVRVRQALSLAINRQELIDTVLAGAGQAASGFLNPAEPGFDSSASAFEYDPEKAKSLLAEAGVSDLSLTCPVRASGQKIMVAVQAYWSAVGVNCDVQLADNGVWASDWAAGNLQITQLGWFPLFADADNHMYTYFYSENAAKKSSFYNNPEFDALMVKGRQSTDESERADIYKQADDILTRQDYATLPLFYPKFQFTTKDYVKNAKVGNLIYHMFDLDIDTTDESYTTA